MKYILLCLLVFAAACGKDKDSSSSRNVFGSQYGVSQTADGYVVLPRANTGGYAFIEAGGRQYQIGQVSQYAGQVLQAMAMGQIQPTRIDNAYARFRARITGSTGYSNNGYGNVGYSVGGYQQPVNTNVLNIEGLQPY